MRNRPEWSSLGLLTGAGIVTILAANPAAAHHPFDSEFDASRPVHLTARVTRLAWASPHVSIEAAVARPDSTVKWTIVADSPYALILRGWRKDALAPGTVVVVDGYQAKDGRDRACGHALRLLDGQTLITGWCAPGGAEGTAIARGRIRYANGRISEAIQFAADRSPTFRTLVEAIDASSAVVFVVEGSCRDSTTPACVPMVRDSGGRALVVHVDTSQSTLDVVRQLAHELQHVAEIISRDDVASLHDLYSEIGYRSCAPGPEACWETDAARATEVRVRREVL